jgi:hypothetical protein
MKPSLRISIILAAISALTIIMLTVLMHFKYHITRTNLMNDRIGVTISTIYSVIDNNLRMGVNIEAQDDLRGFINQSKAKEDIIDEIYILKNSNWNLSTAFSTSKDSLEKSLTEQVIKRLKSAKGNSWSITGENNSVGFTLKDPAGLIRGVILVNYNADLIKSREKVEIENLYKRMSIAILITLLFSFFIGYKATGTLVQTVETIQKSLDKLNAESTNFDLSGINDPSLRGKFRISATLSSKMMSDLRKIDELIESAEKEKLP